MKFIKTILTNNHVYSISVYRGIYGIYKDTESVTLAFSRKEAETKLKQEMSK